MKVGFTCGSMDLLHAGHVLMLQECKQYCDRLIVGLQTDPTLDRPGDKNRPCQTIVERYIQLKAVKYVDEIIPYQTEEDLVELLRAIPFDVRFVGEDWKGKPYTGHDLQGMADKVMYNHRYHDYSSSRLRSRIKNMKQVKHE